MDAVLSDPDVSRPESAKNFYHTYKRLSELAQTIDQGPLFALSRFRSEDRFPTRVVQAACGEFRFPEEAPICVAMSSQYYCAAIEMNLILVPHGGPPICSVGLAAAASALWSGSITSSCARSSVPTLICGPVCAVAASVATSSRPIPGTRGVGICGVRLGAGQRTAGKAPPSVAASTTRARWVGRVKKRALNGKRGRGTGRRRWPGERKGMSFDPDIVRYLVVAVTRPCAEFWEPD